MSSQHHTNNSTGVHTPPQSPLQEVWSIAWPTIITMTSYTVMQFVDAFMVAEQGPLSVAAQGNGGIWAFTAIGATMGLLSVINTYVSQNIGAERPQDCAKYAWAGLWLSGMLWVALLLPFALVLPLVFEWMGHEGRLLAEETGYGQILLVGAMITLAAKSIHHFFFGIHRPKVVTVSALCGNVVNVVANYVLIFGAAGAYGLPGVPGVPALGIYGAAIGTIIGTAVEVLIPGLIFLSAKLHAQFNTRGSWRLDFQPIRELFAIGWPAAVQWGTEISCWAIFMTYLVGRFGDQHMAAGWIALRYMHLSFMPALGINVAVQSLVGKYIGAGSPDTAVSRARLGLFMALGYMTVCAVVFLVFRRPLIGFFVDEATAPALRLEIIDIGVKLMICAAIFQTVDAIGIVYTGALRGAGDTILPGVATVLYSWVVLVGGGWLLAVYVPQLESIGPWIAATAFILLYGFTMLWRFESGGWRRISLLKQSKPATADEERALPLGLTGPCPPGSEPEGAVRDIVEEIGDEVVRSR